jgi:hypothetical protein
MEQIIGFAPDSHRKSFTAFRECSAMVPYANGLEQGLPYASTAYNALAAACIGARYVGTRILAGTSTKLYELSGTTWSDVSRGGNYSAGVTWSFLKFGTVYVATNGANVIQTSTSGAFADQATAPQAYVICSVTSSGGGFVLAFNTIDGTYGTSNDRWWCCAVNDVTSWTPSVATQATTGRLIGEEGPIVAAERVSGDTVVAFKANAMYVGRYVGPPAVWQWREIVGYGCVGPKALCSIDDGVFFVSKDGFYIYDGSALKPIGVGKVKEWWRDLFKWRGTSPLDKVQVVYQKATRRVRIFYPNSSVDYNNECLVYSLDGDNFGKDAMPAGGIDTAFVMPPDFNETWVVVRTTEAINAQGGPAGSGYSLASFITGYTGSDGIVSSMDGLLLRYEQKPKTSVTKPSCAVYVATASGVAGSLSSSVYSNDLPMGATDMFDLRLKGRWFSASVSFAAGDQYEWAKLVGVEPKLRPCSPR